MIDEAYVDFGADASIPLVASHPNLLVVSDAFDELAEIGRTHSGVATELVHLVGGGLDQHDVIGGFCMLEGRFDDKRVGRAAPT